MNKEILTEDALHLTASADRLSRLAECERWLERLKGSSVPEQLHDGLANYLGAGINPGSFLAAVLSSDLSAAIVRADLVCRAALGEIALWLYANAPAMSWGSHANVEDWRAAFAQKRSV